MVSIVLLTTEEVLQRNGYWHCLDATWIAVEMEPFEEVKPEHMFLKPLSRDVYYTKYPDIPRSESEDENPLTVSGFRTKHEEWKSKIRIRKLESRKRYSSQSNYSIKSTNSNPSVTGNDTTARISSIMQKPAEKSVSISNNDSKVQAFFNRLLQSVPPPPINDLTGSKRCSIIAPQEQDKDFNSVELPDYSQFEKDRILNPTHEKSLVPSTSTLKRKQRRVTFNTEFTSSDSWYETIYGVSHMIGSRDSLQTISDGMLSTQISKSGNESSRGNDTRGSLSWSDLVSHCGIGDSILNQEDSHREDNVVSRSHCANDRVLDVSLDDDEAAYANFAVYKICQTLRINEGIIDSSSMNDLNNIDQFKNYTAKGDPSFYRSLYRLAPKDIEDSVNVASEL